MKRMKRMEILVAEPCQPIADLLQTFFEEHGVHVVITAEEVITAIRGACQKFDLVIIDDDLPDQRGSKIVRWIKESSPYTLVILTTGSINEVVCPDADDIFKKVYDVYKLRDRVGKLMQNNKARH